MRKIEAGFTLIELLVVIAIISILSSIILASVNSARERALVARIAQDFRQMEIAFQLWGDSEERSTWWTETELGLGDNPTITDVIANTNLSNTLSVAPSPGGVVYRYDNDGDIHTCVDVWRGVGVYFGSTNSDLKNSLDELFDKGDGGICGKITFDDSNLWYKMQDTQSF